MIDCRTCKGTGKVPANFYDRCDTAVAHGPGHKSISPCTVEGPHDEHYAHGYDWMDENLSQQTYDKKKYEGRPFRAVGVEKTYRLYFAPYM